VTDVTQSFKDAAYVAVGFGVIGFQKAQVRRQEMNRQLRQQRQQFGDLVKGLDGAVQPVRQQIEGRLDQLEGRLPGQARDVVRTARSLAKGTEEQVRTLIGVGA
jgi:uncharacterized protein HemX